MKSKGCDWLSVNVAQRGMRTSKQLFIIKNKQRIKTQTQQCFKIINWHYVLLTEKKEPIFKKSCTIISALEKHQCFGKA